MKFATEAIHSSYDCDEHNRAIMPPIYQNSMFAMHEIGEQIPYRYSRLANPTRKVLEDTMAALEHGAAGFAFASGMAGIDAVWRTFLRPGDTIAAVADIYGGAYDLLTEVYAAWGINVVFADLTDPQSLDTILAAQKVKMLWLETPSNPLLRLVDIEALAAKAKAAGALVGIDNTFATPYLQNPLDMGCDIVFHSATKYLCGHSDVLMGIVVVKEEKPASLLRSMMVNTGGVAGPMLLIGFGQGWVLAPLTVAGDFAYGSVKMGEIPGYEGFADGPGTFKLDRAGRYAAVRADYALDWATPGIIAWYGSGDDGNIKNGSEVMPFVSIGSGGYNISTLGTWGEPWLSNDGIMGYNAVGTWGVGARVMDISFLEDLKHNVRVNYFQGTNDPTMAGYITGTRSYKGQGKATGLSDFNSYGTYLTTEDSGMEVNLDTHYDIYKNLDMWVHLGYIHLWLDDSANMWGGYDKKGNSHGLNATDAWRASISFRYSF